MRAKGWCNFFFISGLNVICLLLNLNGFSQDVRNQQRALKIIGTKVYAIPGNHEYMSRFSGSTNMFIQRFPKEWLSGYVVSLDSMRL